MRLPARGEAAGRRRAQAVSKLDGVGARKPLLRADSALYGAAAVGTAIRAGTDVSVTVRMNPQVKKAITAIGEAAWTTIEIP